MPSQVTALYINSLWSGGLVTNYYCSSKCKHCLYGCSPAWDKNYIDAATVRKNLQKIKSLGCSSVHVGGGEPLLNSTGLIEVLDVAAQTGVTIEYVETNSSWFQDLPSATSLLKDLKSHGLSTLLISMSPFHNEFIPFFKVKGVIAACQQAGIDIFPWIYAFYDEINSLDDQKTHPLSEYEIKFGPEYLKNLAYRYHLSIRGRALSFFKPFTQPTSYETILENNNSGCRELKDVSHFHIDLYGNYIPGLCSGLSIKRDDLGQPIDPTTYPFLTVLYSIGIKGLYELATEQFDFKVKDLYFSKCDLCTDIRRHLVLSKNTTSADLEPRFYYENM